MEEEEHWTRHTQRKAFRAVVGQGFGDELTQHHQQHGDEQKSNAHGNGVSYGGPRHLAEVRFQRLFDGGGHDGFAHPAHQQTDDRDAQLRPRKQRHHIGKQAEHQLRLGITFVGKLFHASAPYAQQSVFRGDKKGVKRHQAGNQRGF